MTDLQPPNSDERDGLRSSNITQWLPLAHTESKSSFIDENLSLGLKNQTTILDCFPLLCFSGKNK